MMKRLLVAGWILSTGLSAQVTTVQRRPFIRSSGEGVVTVRPDQARVGVGVITQGRTAAEASDQNATKAEAVLEALRRLLGPAADIRTTSYNVSPIQRFPPGSTVPEIVGYTATNQFLVTVGDTANAGRVIDTATAAGANSVTGITFGVRDSVPLRQQALRLATQQARANAEAIANGMGGRLSSVVSATEGASVSTPILDRGGIAAGGAATTPVEAGTLEVRATVTLEIEVLQ